MGSIYEYLEAVLGDAENEPQAEEGKQAEESEQAEKGKQGFIDDLRAWLKKEKECRQDLADGLLGELKKKFEDIKSELKKENKSEKEKCEKKERLFPKCSG